MEWVDRGELRLLKAQLPGATAAFTTRLGGVSEGPFESLNLGFAAQDSPNDVAENRRRLAGALGFEVTDVLSARQVHGAKVMSHDGRQADPPFAEPRARDSAPQADAQATRRHGAVPLVLVADCLPIALAPSRGAGDSAVAMVHGGWRPLASGIIDRAVAATGADHAAIGPGIGPCCYRVGDEVRAEFADLERGGEPIFSGGHLDLWQVAEVLLRDAGVLTVERADICTSCNEELFFSHRRDRGLTGRQAGLVWFD